MKTKQILGIVVTGVVIIAVGVTGVISNVISAKFAAEEEALISESLWDMDLEEGVSLPAEDFIGVIDVVGEITSSSSSMLGYTEGGYDHNLYMDYIDAMMLSDYNKGIMLYIDSPGGNVYESDELYLKLMEYKEVTGRPIWAYFASQACSGGYYVAMAADKIYANRNCWTGSIGVVVSLMNMEGLYEKLGIEEIDIVSGENKAMGSAGLELTEEQREILQGLVDEAFDQFVDIIVEGRDMNEKAVRELADGRIYTAKQALELDMIDAIGSYEDQQAAFAIEEGFSPDILYHTPENDFSDFVFELFGMIQDLQPKSDAEVASEILENSGNGVLRYYAE